MSVNVSINVPLDVIASIKNSRTNGSEHVYTISRATIEAVMQLPYNFTSAEGVRSSAQVIDTHQLPTRNKPEPLTANVMTTVPFETIAVIHMGAHNFDSLEEISEQTIKAVRAMPFGINKVVEAAASAQLSLRVNTLWGKVFTIRVTPESTIDEVKDAIQAMTGVPPDQQRLTWSGQQLEDERTISFYKIPAGSAIHLIQRLSGS